MRFLIELVSGVIICRVATGNQFRDVEAISLGNQLLLQWGGPTTPTNTGRLPQRAAT